MPSQLRRRTSQLIVSLLTATALVGVLASPAAASEPGGGSISGTVTRAGGGPLDQLVYVHASKGSYVADWVGYVDRATGTYEIDNLPQGEYLVTFSTVPGGSNLEHPYLTQYWPGAYRESDATLVTVSEENPTATDINAEMAVGGIVQVTATIAVSGAPATGTTLSMYRVDANGNASHIASDTVDANWPFEMSDLPPGDYTVYADASTRSEEPALKPQWLGRATSESSAKTFSVSLDETKAVSLTLKPVDPIAVLPCVPVRSTSALKSLVQRYTEAGGNIRSISRSDLNRYIARCR